MKKTDQELRESIKEYERENIGLLGKKSNLCVASLPLVDCKFHPDGAESVSSRCVALEWARRLGHSGGKNGPSV